MTASKHYTLREAADLTGVSLWAIRQGCEAGTIAHVITGSSAAKDGGRRVHRRMTAEQVEQLCQSRTVEPAPEPAASEDDAMAKAIAATLAGMRRGRRGRRQ